MDEILSIKNLKYSYKDTLIFDDLSLSIRKKTVNAIIGPNNCGKTTLIKLFAGFLSQNNCIYFDKQMITRNNFQQYSLNVSVMLCNNKNNFLFEDVISELVFSVENLGWERKKIKKRLNEVSTLFHINKLLDKKIKELSNMELAKLNFASALMHNPKIIFMDNIFDFLSNNEYIELMKILDDVVSKEEITVVYTTNNLNYILYSDNVFVINDKKLYLSGTVGEILEHDNLLAKIGIEISVMIDMSLKLKFYQLLNEIEIDPRKLVDILWK